MSTLVIITKVYFILILSIYFYFDCMYIYVPYKCLGSTEAREDVGCHGTVIIDGYEPPYGC